MPLGVFSPRDIKKYYPAFDTRRLVEWKEKGYISKVRNSWYVFNDNKVNNFFISNRVYSPSYISLESALSYYGVIPEAVFNITAVTTLKTYSFEFKDIIYSYNTIKTNAYTGYEIVYNDELPLKIATPEKALIDFLYLRKTGNSDKDLLELRLDLINIDLNELFRLTGFFKNKKLEEKVNILVRTYDNIK